MRHCFSETPEVYESEGKNLATLLEDAAETVRQTEGWHAVNVALNIAEGADSTYRVTVYVHN